MKYRKTDLEGVLVLIQEPILDSRGAFARVFCRKELEEAGRNFTVCQINKSCNRLKGTLRGLHFQLPPHQEAKIIQVTKGSIVDVAVDIRRESETFGKYHAETLTDKNGRALLIPEGCAHGFQTLEDDTEIIYLVSAFYSPQAEGGLRWNNPGLDIPWPQIPPQVISDKDKAWPNFSFSK